MLDRCRKFARRLGEIGQLAEGGESLALQVLAGVCSPLVEGGAVGQGEPGQERAVVEGNSPAEMLGTGGAGRGGRRAVSLADRLRLSRANTSPYCLLKACVSITESFIVLGPAG